MSNRWLQSVALVSMLVGAGCSSSSSSSGSGGSTSNSSGSAGQSGSSSGGSSAAGGSSSSSKGGSSAAGGSSSKGGASSEGGSSSSKATGGQGGGTGGNGGGTGTGTGGKGGGGGGGTGTTGGTTGTGGTGTGGKGGDATGGTTGTAGSGGGGTTDTTGPVTVQLGQTRQTIDGFGINNNWQPALSDAEADALFDANKGIGLTILRIGMGSDGKHFNSASPGDISKAKARGAKYIIGSTWSPPGEWKTNGSENDGGHLKTEYYEQWATRIADFAKSNSLYAMSPGNEPDFASCGKTEPCNGNYPTTLYTAKEMVEFIKVVGPKLQANGVKVLAPEASEWLHNWSNLSATGSVPSNKNSSDPFKCGCYGNTVAGSSSANCASTCTQGNGYDYGHWLYKDSKAWAALDIMGVHQYDTQVAEPWPADVPDKKPVWQTEMSGVKWWPEQGPSTDINNGVAVAGWLHNALTVGELNAWLWWWYKAQSADTNEGLLLSNGTDTKRHYTFGNYSKFVRPGYVRVDVTGSVPKDVLISAYKGTDGTVAIVVINKGSAEAKVPIAIAGGTPASCTPNVTSKDADLKAGTAVTVTDGSLSASLGGTSVTTFVCK